MCYEQQLIHWLEQDEECMAVLRLIKQFNLPQGAVAAGFIRNFVWDRLHGFSMRTRLNDVDVIYFNPEGLQADDDYTYEEQLSGLLPQYDWQVRNQARMHMRNQDLAYVSIADAMACWPETATAVAARLNEDAQLEVIAPHGLADLFQLILRQSPRFHDVLTYNQRIETKQWLYHWPQLSCINAAASVRIQFLTGTDVADFRSLRMEGLRLYPEQFVENADEEEYFPLEHIRHKLEKTKQRFVAGAWDHDDRLIGIIGFYRESSAKLQHKGMLWGMYVTPSMQGRGVGSALLYASILHIRKLEGIDSLQVSITSANKAVKRLFERFDFVVFAKELQAMKWEGHIDDIEHMELRLK